MADAATEHSNAANSKHPAGVEAEQLELLARQKLAFDEMNLVELPFALLTDAREANAKPIGLLPLSEGGDERLVASTGSALPTALAERVVLGLLWLTMSENGFRSPVIRFSLRNLLHEYMYPKRAQKSRVGGSFFKRVEQEIRRIAHTRIVSSRWYDKALRQTTHMDAAIIDYVQVIDEGGRNRSRILELRWGDKLFKSVRDRYTKAIDVRTILQIERPLDLRFYRWLDRQLATKDREVVASCQSFARYKLLMRGQKIERGGRTASSYIADKLRESLLRLDDVGFCVEMVVDESEPDFQLEFRRLHDATKNEIVAIDAAGDLVREFFRVAHGLPKDARKRRIAEPDRRMAECWVEEYGAEKAADLVCRAVGLHKASRNGDQPLFSFRGLGLYEAKALADSERSAQEMTLESRQGDVEEA